MNNTNILAKICMFSLIACAPAVAQDKPETKQKNNTEINSENTNKQNSWLLEFGKFDATMFAATAASIGGYATLLKYNIIKSQPTMDIFSLVAPVFLCSFWFAKAYTQGQGMETERKIIQAEKEARKQKEANEYYQHLKERLDQEGLINIKSPKNRKKSF